MSRSPVLTAAGVTACALAAFGAVEAGSAAGRRATPRAEPRASIAARAVAASGTPLIQGMHRISTIASTVPPNGDVNPYGIAIVPTSVGSLHAGRVLVSNFNDRANEQGTGTTIVELSQSGGARSVFAHIGARGLPGRCPGGVGLTTALGIVPGGYVIVGSLPTRNGMSATARPGCLIVLNSRGRPVSTISGPQIRGPWDMATVTQGSTSTLFVSMVLNGRAGKGRHVTANGSVLRIRLTSGAGQAPKVVGETEIADGIPRRADPDALIIGPTGAALAPNGTLYVADTLDNRIAAVPQAMTRTSPASDAGTTVSVGGHLKQPLGVALAPNGDILTTNAGDGNLVETSPTGRQLAVRTLDRKTGAGSLFGLALPSAGDRILFVDDGDNTLKVLR